MLNDENAELIRTRNRLINLSEAERVEVYPALREFVRRARRKHDEMLDGHSLAEFENEQASLDAELEEMVKAGDLTVSGATNKRAHQIWCEAMEQAEHAASCISNQLIDSRRLEHFLTARASSDPLSPSNESVDNDREASVLKGTIEQEMVSQLARCLRRDNNPAITFKNAKVR